MGEERDIVAEFVKKYWWGPRTEEALREMVALLPTSASTKCPYFGWAWCEEHGAFHIPRPDAAALSQGPAGRDAEFWIRELREDGWTEAADVISARIAELEQSLGPSPAPRSERQT